MSAVRFGTFHRDYSTFSHAKSAPLICLNKMNIGGLISNIGREVAKTTHHAGTSSQQGAQSFGKSAAQQLFGSKSDNEDLRHDEIEQKNKEDEQLSEQQFAQVKAQYDEFYARKKKQEEMEKQRDEQEEEAKKMEELNEVKVNRQKEAQIAKAQSSGGETRAGMGNE